MKDKRKVMAILIGQGAKEFNKTWAFPVSKDRYHVDEKGSVTNPDRKNKLSKAEKRKQKRDRVKDRKLANENLL